MEMLLKVSVFELINIRDLLTKPSDLLLNQNQNVKQLNLLKINTIVIFQFLEANKSLLISMEDVTSINFIPYIFQASIITVSNNRLTLFFKFF